MTLKVTKPPTAHTSRKKQKCQKKWKIYLERFLNKMYKRIDLKHFGIYLKEKPSIIIENACRNCNKVNVINYKKIWRNYCNRVCFRRHQALQKNTKYAIVK